MSVMWIFVVFLLLKNVPLPNAARSSTTGESVQERNRNMDWNTRISTISPKQSPTASPRSNLSTQDSFDFFLSVFGLNEARSSSKNEKNSEKKRTSYSRCRVKYKWHNLGKWVLPRRVKVTDFKSLVRMKQTKCTCNTGQCRNVTTFTVKSTFSVARDTILVYDLLPNVAKRLLRSRKVNHIYEDDNCNENVSLTMGAFARNARLLL